MVKFRWASKESENPPSPVIRPPDWHTSDCGRQGVDMTSGWERLDHREVCVGGETVGGTR